MMADRVIFVCTIVIAAVYFYATTLIPTLEIGDPLGPKAFPRLLGVCLLIGAGLLFLEMWKDRKAPQPPASGRRDWRYLWIIAGVTVWTGIYYAAFEKLGYVVATTVFLLALMAWFHPRKWLTNVLSTVLFSVLSFVMFVKLDVNLPRGVAPINWISDAIIVAVNAVVKVVKSILTLS
ncbi:MAG: tripartite tricarboxylate transporter TctB family protein [Burkholderiales bacterium]